MKRSPLPSVFWSLGLLSLVFGPAFADTTVPAQTVTATKEVVDSGKVTTATPGPVVIDPTGKAVFIGGTAVVLSPGFWAKSGSLFRASRDMNLAGLASLNDGDFDGLPDLWELLHFGNLSTISGIGDHDNDGVGNADEYYAGTDPNFNEAAATINPAAVRLIVKTATGKFQKILNDTNWSITSAP